VGEQVPNGPWDALITVRSGLLEESVETSLTFPDVGDGPRIPVSGGFWWWLAALLAAVALGVAIWAKMIRRPSAPNSDDHDGYTHLIA